jgi:hypothetical protein
LFRQKIKTYNYASITSNRFVFGAIILAIWLFISLSLPLIKSHLGASMMVTRYFISVLGIYILILATGLTLIRNKPVLIITLLFIVSFSLIHLFVERDYYNTVTKAQYREFAAELKENNPEKSVIVTYFSWILPYYFQDEPEMQILNNTLENQVGAMKSGAIPQMPFWYADFNLRPYELSAEGQAYLDANFVTVKKLEFHDIWGNYYVPKSYKGLGKHEDGSDYLFLGSRLFFENGIFKSKKVSLAKGNYKLIVNGISIPEVPVKGENAHFKAVYAGKQIGEIYLSEKRDMPEQTILFSCKAETQGTIELIYDNDVFIDGKDRNATLYSVRIIKVK